MKRKAQYLGAVVACGMMLTMATASTVETTLTLDTPGIDPNAVSPGVGLDFTVWGKVTSLSGNDVGIGGYDLRLNVNSSDPTALGAPGTLTYPQYSGSDIWSITVPNLPMDVVGSFLPIGVAAFRQNLGSGSPADGVNGVPLFSFSVMTGVPGVAPATVTLSADRGMSAGSTLGFSLLENLGAGAFAQRGTDVGDTIIYNTFDFTVVPEPSPLLLLAVPAILLPILRRRVDS